MLRKVPRAVRLCTFIRYAEPIAARRTVLATRRRYADKKSSPDNVTPPMISDYIAPQPPASSPEIPADRMHHQTEEDIATEMIVNDEPRSGNEDGLHPEGVPVEDVFKEDPEAMKKAPEAIMEDISLNVVVDRQDGTPSAANEMKTAQVGDESIATEGIISGIDKLLGAENTTSGEEIPAAPVPIEEVFCDWEESAVMEESSKDADEPPRRVETVQKDSQKGSCTITEKLRATDANESGDSVSATRKSILDLFGPASSNKRNSAPQEPPEERSINPLKAHYLDTTITQFSPPEDPLGPIPPEVDLSAWAENVGQLREKSIKDIDPEHWATTQRGSWEEQQYPETTIPQAPGRPPPRPVAPRGTKAGNIQPKLFEAKAVTPWDYFYPPPKAAKTIDWARKIARERENSSLRTPKESVYDPFAEMVRQPKWPFLYNRDQLLDKCINLLMTHGKKARAERVMQQTLMRLIEHNPRAHPVTYLAEALDRNSPLVKNSSSRMGTKSFTTPFSLFESQRIRIGWMALIQAAGGKPGRERNREGIPFADRLAREIIKVMEGRGPGLANRLAEHKKAMIHKLAVLPKGSTNR